jgi:hypothetical protein
MALVLAHGAVGGGHMTADEHDPGTSETAISICLAVVEAGGLLLAVVGGMARLRRRPPICLPGRDAMHALAPHSRVLAPPTRAGPAVLQVFLR